MNFDVDKLISNRATARMAGLLYLIMIVSGFFAMTERGNLIVLGDSAATVSNIMASGDMLRIAFMSDLVMATCYLLFAWVLYVLLKRVNKNVALLFTLLTTASVAIISLNLLNQFAAITLLSGPGYLAAFGTQQLNALVMLFLDLHYHGYYIAQFTFGLWLLPLGYLVYKSGYLPKLLGIFLIIATIGHLAGFFTAFMLPGYESIADAVAIFEIPFGLWLLIKGAADAPKVKAPVERSATSL